MRERGQERTPDTPAPDTVSPMSAREAATRLSINERTIRRAIAHGLLPATKRSGVWELHPDDLDRWDARRQAQPTRRAATRTPPLSIVPFAPPFRVPVPRAPLFGREAAVQEIASRIVDSASALITLTGPGGSGKTRLALAVASVLRDRFADGIWFVDCSSLRDPRHVLPTIVQALGLSETAGQSASERLRKWLAPRELLIVLDNLEQVAGAASDLAHLLNACPDLTILATSRRALRVSMEQQIPVPPLALPSLAHMDDLERIGAASAVQLFVARTQRIIPAFELDAANTPDVVAICQRLDGLPLAIELAAAHSKVLPPHALVERLDRLLPLLTDGPTDQPDRLRSMRQAIAWSYDLLDPALQRAFRRLSIFVGGFTPESATWVLSSTPDDALRALAALLDHNLIIPTPSSIAEPRFTMLETIHEFGLDMLNSAGELTSTRSAHANWCFDLCKRARPHLLTSEHTHWGTVLTEDHANIRAAMDYLAALEDKTQIITIVGWLWNFWFVRNHFTEGIAWMKRTVAWSEGQHTPERVLLLVGAGALWHAIGDQPTARRHNEEALAIYTKLDLDNPEYSPLTGLAIDAAIRGDREEARHLNETLLALLRRHEESAPMARPLLSITLNNMAWDCFSQGEIAEAHALANDALQIKRALQFSWALVDTLFLLALLAERRGEAQTATALFRESLNLVLADRDLRQATNVLHKCTRLLSDANDHERVTILIGAVDSIRERIGAPLDPRAVADRELWQKRATDLLGADGFDRLYRAGWTMSLEEMVAFALIAEVRPPRINHGVSSPWSLTPREREVLALLVEGSTDQDIADRLFVSRRTANAHVANILSKMNVPNRRQAIQRARACQSAPTTIKI